MKCYYDPLDPDYVRLPWLERDDEYELGLIELDVPEYELDRYFEIIEYIESFPEKLEEWKV